jgi:hypothetical protein
MEDADNGAPSPNKPRKPISKSPLARPCRLKWHSNYGHLEKSDINIRQFEVNYDNRKKELFKTI